MHSKKVKRRPPLKFRLLLDSAFASPSTFHKLSKKAAVKHIRHDFHLSPTAEDEEIYNLAGKEHMMVVTINFKDFQKLVRKNMPGILAIDSGLTNNEIDEALSKFIAGKDPLDYVGKAVRVK